MYMYMYATILETGTILNFPEFGIFKLADTHKLIRNAKLSQSHHVAPLGYWSYVLFDQEIKDIFSRRHFFVFQRLFAGGDNHNPERY